MDTTRYADFILGKTAFVDQLIQWLTEYGSNKEFTTHAFLCFQAITEGAGTISYAQFTKIITKTCPFFAAYAKQMLCNQGDEMTRFIVSCFLKLLATFVEKCVLEANDDVSAFLDALIKANNAFIARCIVTLLNNANGIEKINDEAIKRPPAYYSLLVLERMTLPMDVRPIEFCMNESKGRFWDHLASLCLIDTTNLMKTLPSGAWRTELHQKTEYAILLSKLVLNYIRSHSTAVEFKDHVQNIENAQLIQKLMYMNLPLPNLNQLLFEYLTCPQSRDSAIVALGEQPILYQNVLKKGLRSLCSDTILDTLESILQLLRRRETFYSQQFEIYGIWNEIDVLQSHEEYQISDTASLLMNTYQSDTVLSDCDSR
jgi:hypothetical protein